MMKARFFCKTGQLAGASFEIAREATIGKNPGNTIQLYPALISGQHARIYFDDKAGSYFLEDMNSRNGTKLDGVPVKGKQRLDRLHVITLANAFDFFFQVLEPTAVSGEQPAAGPVPQKREQPKPAPPQPGASAVKTPRVAPPPPEERMKTVFDDEALAAPQVFEERNEKMPSAAGTDEGARTKVGIEITPLPSFAEPSKPPKEREAPSTAGAFVLVFESLKGKPQAFDLQEGTTVVGRDASCTIVVDDPSVSRRHAEFVLNGGRLTLKDLGSKNCTYIDDQRISKEVEVHEGRQIAFGLVRARLIRKPTR
jgi:pSer/pThr/pTyr-binding forkhead associated (FHA) protein